MLISLLCEAPNEFPSQLFQFCSVLRVASQKDTFFAKYEKQLYLEIQFRRFKESFIVGPRCTGGQRSNTLLNAAS